MSSVDVIDALVLLFSHCSSASSDITFTISKEKVARCEMSPHHPHDFDERFQQNHSEYSIDNPDDC